MVCMYIRNEHRGKTATLQVLRGYRVWQDMFQPTKFFVLNQSYNRQPPHRALIPTSKVHAIRFLDIVADFLRQSQLSRLGHYVLRRIGVDGIHRLLGCFLLVESYPIHFRDIFLTVSRQTHRFEPLHVKLTLALLRLLNIFFSSAAKFSDTSVYGRIRVICTSRARSMTMSSTSDTCLPVFDTTLHGLVHVFISLGVMPGCLTLATSTWSPTAMSSTTHFLSTPHTSRPIHAQQLKNL